MQGIFHAGITRFKIGAIYLQAFNAFEAGNELVGIHATRFIATHANTPIVVFY